MPSARNSRRWPGQLYQGVLGPRDQPGQVDVLRECVFTPQPGARIIHAKTEAPSNDGDYQIAIQRVVETEVRPAALEFKNKLESIHETLFGKFKGSAIKWVRGSGLAHLLAGMSWSQVLMPAGGAVAAEAVAHVSEARQARRSARRECAISYVLDIESQESEN